jgi:hypothetical protein
MGQYYYVVNLDKKQYLYPHKFGEGVKLLEFGCSSNGTLTGLAILLADGGGDLHSDNPIIGSWAGDRIVIAGDYADARKFVPGGEDTTLYGYAEEHYEDISQKVLRAMCDDCYIAEDLKRRKTWQGDESQPVYDYAMTEGGTMSQQPKTQVRELTQHVYHSLLLDEWPRNAGIIDFGLKSTEHYGALQYAVKCEGVTPEQLDAALGKGAAIQALISKTNPYRNVVFKTDYDDMPEEPSEEEEEAPSEP